MPAKFVKSYQSPTGTVFATLAEAQIDEMKLVLTQLPGSVLQSQENIDMIASHLVANKASVVECLKQKERERVREPKARKPRAKNVTRDEAIKDVVKP